MSRPKRAQPKVRLNLDLTPAAKARLVMLKERLDADSFSEVIRRALELLEVFLDKGGK